MGTPIPRRNSPHAAGAPFDAALGTWYNTSVHFKYTPKGRISMKRFLSLLCVLALAAALLAGCASSGDGAAGTARKQTAATTPPMMWM